MFYEEDPSEQQMTENRNDYIAVEIHELYIFYPILRPGGNGQNMGALRVVLSEPEKNADI